MLSWVTTSGAALFATASLITSTLLLLLAAAPNPAFADIQIPELSFDSPVTYAGSSAHYIKQYDVCDVCDGDTTTCQGCNRIPNSPFIFDACGTCQNPFNFINPGQPSVLFNSSCNDCSGIDKRSDGGYTTPGTVYGAKVGWCGLNPV